jgi:hypothetical protein
MSQANAIAFAVAALASAVAAQSAPQSFESKIGDLLAKTPAQKNIVAVHKQIEAAAAEMDVVIGKAVVVFLGGNVEGQDTLQAELISAIDTFEALKPIHEAAHEQYTAEKAQRAEVDPGTDGDGFGDSLDTSEADAVEPRGLLQ